MSFSYELRARASFPKSLVCSWPLVPLRPKCTVWLDPLNVMVQNLSEDPSWNSNVLLSVAIAPLPAFWGTRNGQRYYQAARRSVLAESCGGLDSRGSCGRDRRGSGGNQGHQDCRHQQRERIDRSYAIEQGPNPPSRQQSAAQAEQHTEPDHHASLQAQHSTHVRSFRAECHADPDLATPLLYRKRQQTVDTNRRQNRGEASEHRGKGGRQTFGGGACLHLFRQGMDFGKRQRRVDGGERGAHRLNHGIGGCPCTDAKHRQTVIAGHIVSRRHGLPQGTILGIADHADDLIIGLYHVVHPVAEMLPDRVPIREKAVDKSLVDDSRRWFRRLDVGLCKVAASNHADSHSVEILRRDPIEAGVQEIGARDLLSSGRDGAFDSAAAHHRAGCRRGGNYSENVAHA